MSGKFFDQPIHTLIKALASDCTAFMNGPVPVLYFRQAEHFANILFRGSIREVLLVSEDEQGHIFEDLFLDDAIYTLRTFESYSAALAKRCLSLLSTT